MRAEGIYDVDANTSIDQLSEDLFIEMPEVCQIFVTRTDALDCWLIVDFSLSFTRTVILNMVYLHLTQFSGKFGDPISTLSENNISNAKERIESLYPLFACPVEKSLQNQKYFLRKSTCAIEKYLQNQTFFFCFLNIGSCQTNTYKGICLIPINVNMFFSCNNSLAQHS